MSTLEIIAELPRPKREELALIQAKLCELVESARDTLRLTRIHSPRLARAEQAKDFRKQIIEIDPNAGL